MTVKEVVGALKTAAQIKLAYGANVISFDKTDVLAMDAFGGCLVDEICSDGEGYYELNIVMRPVKAGAA